MNEMNENECVNLNQQLTAILRSSLMIIRKKKTLQSVK